jgi:hypothetical protein
MNPLILVCLAVLAVIIVGAVVVIRNRRAR